MIELDESEPPAGTVRVAREGADRADDPGGPEFPFTGWLDLIAALEQAVGRGTGRA